MTTLRNQIQKYGDWALVAGAADGLGYAFSKTLAACGKNVILVDVNKENLDSAAEHLESQFEVETDKIVCDLSKRDTYKVLMESILARRCRLVIYNAAYGPVKRLDAHEEKELDLILDLNCRTLLKLAWAYCRETPRNEKSGFLAMSSLAGLRGTQLVAPYAASKAFAWNLMESLHYEFDSHNIDFSALCAGPIATPNYLETKPSKTVLTPKPQDPGIVARHALGTLGKKAIGIPGLANNLNDFILSRLMPRSWALKITNHVMGQMYLKK